MGNRVLVTPIQTGDRTLDQWNREARLQQTDVYNRIETLETPTSRIMPLDGHTDLWWPCDDRAPSTTVRNIGNYKATGDNLVALATCIPSLGGLVHPQCFRLYGGDATRGASGAAGMTGASPQSVTVSCWIRFSNIGASGSLSYAFGYVNAANSLASILLGVSPTGFPFVQIQTVAGVRTTNGVSDMKISDGDWHFLMGTYDGSGLAIYVDGNGAGNGFSASPIVWSIAGSPTWRLGIQPASSSMHGLIQDCRMHSTRRSGEWCDEAWRRGMNLYGSR